MGFKNWVQAFFGSEAMEMEILSSHYSQAPIIAMQKLYFNSCVDLMAKMISKCEFKVFKEDEPVKNEEYYLWNYAPNQNQSPYEFFNELIFKLFANNEVLVIENKKKLYIADSFNKEIEGVGDAIFKEVTVNSVKFEKDFKVKEVLYFKLSDGKIKKVIDEAFVIYKDLISAGISQYKSDKGNKGFLERDVVEGGTDEEVKKRTEKMKEQFDKYWKSDNAVMPLPKGNKYVPLMKSNSNTGSTQATTRDIRAMMNDVATYMGTAFGISPKLLIGDVENTTHALTETLTLGLNPLCKILEVEITNKRWGFRGFDKGSRLTIDTKGIKYVDLLTVADAIDKLIGSGAYNRDEVRALSGDLPIPNKAGEEYFMTKNLATVDEVLKGASENGNSE